MQSRPPDATNTVPTPPGEILRVFSNAPFQWWIAGGWALDLFMGHQTRPHFDTDVAIARKDQRAAQQYLSKWDFGYALRKGDEIVIQHWEPGQVLGRDVHGIWARQTPDLPWCFEFWLHEIDEEVWSFRYFGSVQHPLARIGGRTLSEGIPFLQPEIALLYKAARMRLVDIQDFHQVLPHLGSQQRSQLAADILRCWPDHSWLAALK